MPVELTKEEIEDLMDWLGFAYARCQPVELAKIRRMKVKLYGMIKPESETKQSS